MPAALSDLTTLHLVPTAKREVDVAVVEEVVAAEDEEVVLIADVVVAEEVDVVDSMPVEAEDAAAVVEAALTVVALEISKARNRPLPKFGEVGMDLTDNMSFYFAAQTEKRLLFTGRKLSLP